jgi:protease I
MSADLTGTLTGTKIAILATDGVEGVELTSPREALEQAGATVELLAPAGDSIQLWDHAEKDGTLAVDRTVSEADPEEYDGLVLPGGVRNADHLRMDAPSVQFVTAMSRRGVPIGVICHGAWILIEAQAITGRTITSYPSLRTDLRNAGAHWVDEEVHNDGGLISSRRPDDLPAFNAALIDAFAESARRRDAA